MRWWQKDEINGRDAVREDDRIASEEKEVIELCIEGLHTQPVYNGNLVSLWSLAYERLEM